MNERKGFRLALPGIFWLTIFFMLPLLFVLVASFMSRGTGGRTHFTLDFRTLRAHL